jgi:hypothetical protein
MAHGVYATTILRGLAQLMEASNISRVVLSAADGGVRVLPPAQYTQIVLDGVQDAVLGLSKAVSMPQVHVFVVSAADAAAHGWCAARLNEPHSIVCTGPGWTIADTTPRSSAADDAMDGVLSKVITVPSTGFYNASQTKDVAVIPGTGYHEVGNGMTRAASTVPGPRAVAVFTDPKKTRATREKAEAAAAADAAAGGGKDHTRVAKRRTDVTFTTSTRPAKNPRKRVRDTPATTAPDDVPVGVNPEEDAETGGDADADAASAPQRMSTLLLKPSVTGRDGPSKPPAVPRGKPRAKNPVKKAAGEEPPAKRTKAAQGMSATPPPAASTDPLAPPSYSRMASDGVYTIGLRAADGRAAGMSHPTIIEALTETNVVCGAQSKDTRTPATQDIGPSSQLMNTLCTNPGAINTVELAMTAVTSRAYVSLVTYRLTMSGQQIIPRNADERNSERLRKTCQMISGLCDPRALVPVWNSSDGWIWTRGPSMETKLSPSRETKEQEFRRRNGYSIFHRSNERRSTLFMSRRWTTPLETGNKQPVDLVLVLLLVSSILEETAARMIDDSGDNAVATRRERLVSVITTINIWAKLPAVTTRFNEPLFSEDAMWAYVLGLFSDSCRFTWPPAGMGVPVPPNRFRDGVSAEEVARHRVMLSLVAADGSLGVDQLLVSDGPHDNTARAWLSEASDYFRVNDFVPKPDTELGALYRVWVHQGRMDLGRLDPSGVASVPDGLSQVSTSDDDSDDTATAEATRLSRRKRRVAAHRISELTRLHNASDIVLPGSVCVSVAASEQGSDNDNVDDDDDDDDVVVGVAPVPVPVLVHRPVAHHNGTATPAPSPVTPHPSPPVMSPVLPPATVFVAGRRSYTISVGYVVKAGTTPSDASAPARAIVAMATTTCRDVSTVHHDYGKSDGLVLPDRIFPNAKSAATFPDACFYVVHIMNVCHESAKTIHSNVVESITDSGCVRFIESTRVDADSDDLCVYAQVVQNN